MIIGGGFAGATLARRLARSRLPAGWDVMLISEDSFTTYNPLLSEVVGASLFPEHGVAPLREVIGTARAGRFVMGDVTAIDTAARAIDCRTLAGEQRFDYDQLVLAFGNRARTDLIAGMADHALPLKTIGDALHIRNIVLQRLARIELETDPAVRAALGRFIVIGGGFSGCEMAGALIDCLRGVARHYRLADPASLGVTLLQDIDRLLPELPASLGAAAERTLTRRGVTVRLGAAARLIDADGVELADGARLAAGTVIATIGTRPNALVAMLGLPTERGRIVVGPTMAVADVDGVWALGDCAFAVNALDGAPCPPTAQFAVQQAMHLAGNLVAVAHRRDPAAFSYKRRGAMAALGHLNGVGKIYGIPVRGFPAWLLWRAYYLSQMPTFGRKFRIFIEWSWGMFFAPDITHIRFTRSGEQGR